MSFVQPESLTKDSSVYVDPNQEPLLSISYFSIVSYFNRKLVESGCSAKWFVRRAIPFLEAKRFFTILKKNRVAPTPAKFGGFGSKA